MPRRGKAAPAFWIIERSCFHIWAAVPARIDGIEQLKAIAAAAAGVVAAIVVIYINVKIGLVPGW
jgi:hypothetical protein